jgi:hypothetical protein
MTCIRKEKIDMGQNTFKEAKKGVKYKKLPCSKSTWFIYVLKISNHGNHGKLFLFDTYKCQKNKIKYFIFPNYRLWF